MITLETERAKLNTMDLRDPRALAQSEIVDRLIYNEMKELNNKCLTRQSKK